MNCRMGCGACCVAPSISAAIPGMPDGKPAGVKCVQLTDDNLCRLFESSSRPAVCVGFKASLEMCGSSAVHAYNYLSALEEATAPSPKAS